MKVLLTTLNAKYVHTSLALQYLQAAAVDHQTILQEYTINEPIEHILASIYSLQADVVAFSCYIWNIEKIIRLSSDLKKVSPKTKIIFGGPEVSYEVEDLLKENPYLDFVVIGEGEESFSCLLDYLEGKGLTLEDIPGLAFRKNGQVVINKRRTDNSWTSYPSPFSQKLSQYYHGKNLYYESSRGCPFKCSYCLSGQDGGGVSFLPLERVKEELKILATSGAKQIKFVDRTFNCNQQRALAIWQYILSLQQGNNYHFEISADLLNEETIEFLATVPSGLFNFEIGVQTVQKQTMESIYRASSLPKAFNNIKQLLKETKVRVYLDLIVGLPYESYEKFQESFNQVLQLNPHKLQMGFLKILKGSQISKETDLYGYKYSAYPPYEILENNFLSFGEISDLKRIEHLLDRYYNSGNFQQSHNFILKNLYSSPFKFYQALAKFWLSNGLFTRSLSLAECYSQLYAFVQQEKPDFTKVFQEVLRFDYLAANFKGNLPSWCGKIYTKKDKEKHAQLINDPQIISRYLPHLACLSRKERINLTHSEKFTVNFSGEKTLGKPCWVIFDYSKDRLTNNFVFIEEDL